MMMLTGNSNAAKSWQKSEMYSSYCTERSFHISTITVLTLKKSTKRTTALPGFWFYHNIETVWNVMLSTSLTLFSSKTRPVIDVTAQDWNSRDIIRPTRSTSTSPYKCQITSLTALVSSPVLYVPKIWASILYQWILNTLCSSTTPKIIVRS